MSTAVASESTSPVSAAPQPPITVGREGLRPMFNDLLQRLADRADLTRDEAASALSQIVDHSADELQAAAFLAFAMAVLLAMTAREIVTLVYGSQWLAMVPAFIVMCGFSAARTLGGLASPLFQAVGKPQIVVRLLFLQLAVMAVGIYPLTISLGILGTALAVTCAAVSNQFAVFHALSRYFQVSVLSLVKQIFPFLVATALAVVACLVVGSLVGHSGSWLALVVRGITTGLVYVAVTAAMLRRQLLALLEFAIPRCRFVASNGSR